MATTLSTVNWTGVTGDCLAHNIEEATIELAARTRGDFNGNLGFRHTETHEIKATLFAMKRVAADRTAQTEDEVFALDALRRSQDLMDARFERLITVDEEKAKKAMAAYVQLAVEEQDMVDRLVARYVEAVLGRPMVADR